MPRVVLFLQPAFLAVPASSGNPQWKRKAGGGRAAPVDDQWRKRALDRPPGQRR
ncbi:hypothetical protein X777_13916 [Ooceraea biroi]|uniref:Uncharacterized protein n=1 Tax=Ooceraea biroi TaxID=2015173 RepID=A0A026WWI4_OOCBI|nr:hypothetical protein X777_13916 [Ooceraea biroi]